MATLLHVQGTCSEYLHRFMYLPIFPDWASIDLYGFPKLERESLESVVPWTVARASMIPFWVGLGCHRDDASRDMSVPRSATLNSTP